MASNLQYICPGCLYFGKYNIISFNYFFKCSKCYEKTHSSNDPKIINLCKMFSKHNKGGFKCNDCKRWLPKPFNNIKEIFCPYFDCCYVGDYTDLKKTHHPKLKANDPFFENEGIIHESENLIINNINIIKNIINDNISLLPYYKSDISIMYNTYILNSFKNLLDKYPDSMLNYLINDSRSGGFQHKIFQEYIKLLENNLPITIKKNNKLIKIDNLLDNNLNLFDGISNYDSFISHKFEIPNQTNEFYIGGRKAAYTKPYYIGKLLDVVDKFTGYSLINSVEEYSFSKIKMKNNFNTNINVKVTHLRIPPHYQMGGMAYINRARKKISDEAKLIINKDTL